MERATEREHPLLGIVTTAKEVEFVWTKSTRKERWNNHKSKEAGDRPMQERREWNTRLDMQNLEPLRYTATRRWSTESSNLDIAIQSAAYHSSVCARPAASHSARSAFKLPPLRPISELNDSVLQCRVTVYPRHLEVLYVQVEQHRTTVWC